MAFFIQREPKKSIMHAVMVYNCEIYNQYLLRGFDYLKTRLMGLLNKNFRDLYTISKID